MTVEVITLKKLSDGFKRTAICLCLVLTCVFVRGQDKQLYAEVKDTIETAYHTYYTGGWEQNGFAMYPAEKSDSVGIDSIRITKVYYLEKYDPYKHLRAKSDTILHYAVRRVYLQIEQKEYINGCSSYDSRFSGR